jgi:hypothetical protein
MTDGFVSYCLDIMMTKPDDHYIIKLKSEKGSDITGV